MQYSVIWVQEKILKIYLAVIYVKKIGKNSVILIPIWKWFLGNRNIYLVGIKHIEKQDNICYTNTLI